MIEYLMQPFEYDYMLKAIWSSALISSVCAFLSCFVILKRWSLMGDALSHAVVPGVAIAYLVGAPFALGAFVSGIIAAVGMAFVKTRTELKEDTVIGIVFTSFFAFGLLLISLYPSEVSLKTIIFGNILGISDSDLIQVAAISGVTLLILFLKWKDYALFCFDPGHAKVLGLNVRFMHYTLLTLLSATAVAALQTVGACLVVATLVTPGATAYLLTDKFSTLIKIAVSAGFISGFAGSYISYFLDGSTGGCIIVLQTIMFLCALFFSPKYGIVAGLRKKKSVISGMLAE